MKAKLSVIKKVNNKYYFLGMVLLIASVVISAGLQTVIAQVADMADKVVPAEKYNNHNLSNSPVDDIYLDLAQPGSSVLLDAQRVSTKFILDDLGRHDIEFYDGRCNAQAGVHSNRGVSAGHVDDSLDFGCAPTDNDITFSFYATDSKENIISSCSTRGGAGNTISHASLTTAVATGPPEDQWFGISLDLNDSLSGCANMKRSSASGKYVVVMVAEFTNQCSGAGCSGTGRINAFKVRISTEDTYSKDFATYRAPGIVLNENGTVDTASSVAYRNYGNRYAGPLATSSYALQNRERRQGSDNDMIGVQFQVPCNYVQSGTGFSQFYLRWHDADHADAGGSPADADIRWELFNTTTGQIVESASGGGTIGGQDEFREYGVPSIAANQPKIKAGDVLIWRWLDVGGNNGVQLWIPFDSAVSNRQGCTKISGNKLDINNQAGSDIYINDDLYLFHLDYGLNDADPATPKDTNDAKFYDFGKRFEPFPGNSFAIQVRRDGDASAAQRSQRDGWEVFGYSFCKYPIEDINPPTNCHDQNNDGAPDVKLTDTETVFFAQSATSASGHYPVEIGDLTNKSVNLNWYYRRISDYNIDTNLTLNDSVVVPGETYGGTVTAKNVSSVKSPATQLVVAQSQNDPDSVNGGTTSAGSPNGGGPHEYLQHPTNAFSSGPDASTDRWRWSPGNVGPINGGATVTRTFTYTVDPNARPGDKICFYSRVNRDTPDNEYDYSPGKPDTVCVTIVGNGDRVYAANHININPTQVRDNQLLNVSVRAYLWPNAGHKVNDNGVRFWLAGIYGDERGDVGNHPNTLNNFNYSAEQNCPGPRPGCANNLPLAYVSTDDGSGEANTSVKDGSRTPNGNNWLAIRNESFGGGFSGAVSCVGLGPNRYYDRCGGTASNRTDFAGGRSGNFLLNVETSNIRIEAVGIDGNTRDPSLQSGISAKTATQTQKDILEPDGTTTDAFIISSTNSQGPISNTNQPMLNVWDNIRSPQSGSSFFSQTQTAPVIDYDNNNFGSRNFDLNPLQLGRAYQGRSREYININGRSLLQDGNDKNPPAYDAASERLSYTAALNKIDAVRLKWDEYAEWTQVDDKGHYYTARGTRAIGLDRGPQEGNFNTTVNRIRVTNYGTSSYTHTHADWSCGSTWTDSNHNGREDAGERTPRTCQHSHPRGTTTNCVSGTYIAYNPNTRSYYTPNSETRYGWYNSSTSGGANIPYGGQGQTSFSRFGNNTSSNPNWANTGNTAFWQDNSIGTYDTSGRIGPYTNTGAAYSASKNQRWIYNNSDPLYSGRQIFSNIVTPSFSTGWYRAGTDCVSYYDDGSSETYTVGATVGSYYPNSTSLYESSSCATAGARYGLCNTTFDGSQDNVVDTGWNWVTNAQRVRYENTWFGHTRKLGSYPGSGYNALALAGLDPNKLPLPARGSAIITNSTVSLRDADVYASGAVDSYFQTSNANSAFIFTNSPTVNNVSSGRNFTGYFINPDEDVAADFLARPGDAVNSIFTNYTDLVAESTTIGGTISGTFDLGNGGIYRRSGNLTVNATQFRNGEGTIIVTGDLIINGDTTYQNVSARDDVPSVGFIVHGNIIVRSNVSSTVGAFFTNGCFHTGSVLVSNTSCTNIVGNNNSTASDVPFTLRGLVVARRFALVRQLSGGANTFQNSENFIYDGRIVISTPPGFSRVFSAPAAWNDGVPID